MLNKYGCLDVEPFELMQSLDLVCTVSMSNFVDTELSPASASPELALLTAWWQRVQRDAEVALGHTMLGVMRVSWKVLSTTLDMCNKFWLAKMW